MKCEKCPNAATLHITEILGENHIEEVHLCEVCAGKYLSEDKPVATSKAPLSREDLEDSELGQTACDLCGLKFIDFRNTGRLGCPHDYEVFREELVQLLENIHGETRHIGKIPRRSRAVGRNQNEVIRLRKQLDAAVTKENYEEAARLRDRIRRLEEQ
jgi:protein arginine kinase activator